MPRKFTTEDWDFSGRINRKEIKERSSGYQVSFYGNHILISFSEFTRGKFRHLIRRNRFPERSFSLLRGRKKSVLLFFQ